jgi:hypothetical protein
MRIDRGREVRPLPEVQDQRALKSFSQVGSKGMSAQSLSFSPGFVIHELHCFFDANVNQSGPLVLISGTRARVTDITVNGQTPGRRLSLFAWPGKN